MRFRIRLYLTAAVGGILSLICFLSDMGDGASVQYLTRPLAGTGTLEQEVRVEIKGEDYPFTVKLLEQPCEEEEIQSVLNKAEEGMEHLFLNGNKDLAHIEKNVRMPSVYPDTQVAIQWYLSPWEYIDPDGTVKNVQLTEAVTVKVQASLSFQGVERLWEREVMVCPPEELDEEQVLQALAYEIEKVQEEPKEELKLPDTIRGASVTWRLKADDRWIWMLGLTAVVLVAMVTGQKQEEQTKKEEREQSLKMDYPEIVSRLSLYMGAGISTRKAWERIVANYEDATVAGRSRPAYEEMRVTLYEMQTGVSEALAYERFGSRCHIPVYLKLGTLLEQNLRKGTKNLSDLLLEEAREAFEDRKAMAKKTGEECESKLLLPMAMMLLTVLILIMYPAVTSFQM